MAPRLARRLACLLYESMLLFGVAFAATFAFSVLADLRSGMDPRRPWLIAFLAVVFGLYFSWCWSRGQTLAMRTWKIKVVDRTDRPPRLARALFRYACSWLWLLPPMAFVAPLKLSAAGMVGAVTAWMALYAVSSLAQPQRQFWHDVLAGTRLVPADDAAPAHPGPPS